MSPLKILELRWLRHDKLNRLLKNGPTVLGAQASSPARVPPNQQPLTELVALDAGRRGRLRSQDRRAFLQEPLKHIGLQTNQNGNPGALGCRFGLCGNGLTIDPHPFPLRGTLH